MFEGVHGMRVYLTRVWCCIGVRVLISYLLCFDGFSIFLFICVFWTANKMQDRVCAERNFIPFL